MPGNVIIQTVSNLIEAQKEIGRERDKQKMCARERENLNREKKTNFCVAC